MTKRRQVPTIAISVCLALLGPELRVRLRDHSAEAAVVHVPIAAVNENHPSFGAKHKIGSTRQPTAVQPIPKPHRINDPSNEEFRLRVLAADAAHVEAALFSGQNVRHASVLRTRAMKLSSVSNSTLLFSG